MYNTYKKRNAHNGRRRVWCASQLTALEEAERVGEEEEAGTTSAPEWEWAEGEEGPLLLLLLLWSAGAESALCGL